MSISYHVAGTKGSEHIKTIIKDTGYLLQQLFNPGKTGLKFKYEIQAIMAPHKELYTGMQKAEKQLNIASIFISKQPPPSPNASFHLITVTTSQPGTPASFP
jgi:hypothetical protein